MSGWKNFGTFEISGMVKFIIRSSYCIFFLKKNEILMKHFYVIREYFSTLFSDVGSFKFNHHFLDGVFAGICGNVSYIRVM